MAGDQMYTEQEAEEILRLASRQSGDGISRDRLLHMADELGLSADAIESAAETVRNQRTELAERQEFDVFLKRSFFNHLSTYIIVNLGLIGFNLAEQHYISWAIWPIIGWGIGVASQASRTFFRGGEGYEQEFQKWRANRTTGKAYEGPNVVIGVSVGQSRTNRTDTTALLPKVEDIALRDNLTKLEAIRQVRKQAGIGLKEAKDAVDEFERQNPGIFQRS